MLLLIIRNEGVKCAKPAGILDEAQAEPQREDAATFQSICGADGDGGMAKGMDARSPGNVGSDAAALPAVAAGGPILMRDAANRMRFKRQTLDPVVRRLEERGWVKRERMNLPRMALRPRSKTRLIGPRRRRWGIGVIALTPETKKFIGEVFPGHAKVVKALMGPCSAARWGCWSKYAASCGKGRS